MSLFYSRWHSALRLRGSFFREPLHRIFVKVTGADFEKLTPAASEAGLSLDELRRFLLH